MLRPRTKVIQPPPDDSALIGYARVSTAEQSLEMQVEALKRAGVHPDHIHQEHVSAVSAKRHQLEWAIANLREGDTLVVWKLDRLARSVADLLRLVDLIEKRGARLRSLTDAIDTTTAAGRMIMIVIGAMAQFERDLTIERTRERMRQMKAAGVRFGQAPKLTKEQVKEARRLKKQRVPMKQIAKQFKVSYGTIRNWTRGT